MLRVSLLIIILLSCSLAFSQRTKRETMLKAHQLLEYFKWSNWKEAEKLVLPLADNGDAEAQYIMSRIRNYETNDLMALRFKKEKAGIKGWFISPTKRTIQKRLASNHKEMINWLIKANSHTWILNKDTSDEDSIRAQYVATYFNADDNYPPGGNSLGIFLTFGIKKRLEIIRKAAEKNIYNAPLTYSSYLSNDSLESLKWLKIAADNNNREALYALGLRYKSGRWVKKDINKALDYLTKSLEAGWSEAGTVLGDMYYKGEEVSRDLDKAIYYYEKDYNCQLKLAQALYSNYTLISLGNIYVEKKEYQKAISIYQLVSESSREIGEARYRMGEIYATLDQYNKAVYWLQKSDYKDASRKLKEIRNR